MNYIDVTPQQKRKPKKTKNSEPLNKKKNILIISIVGTILLIGVIIVIIIYAISY